MLVFAVGVFAPGVASSQDATITGTVTDATGGILPGVAVEARDAAGTAQVTVTDGTGQFTFSGLTPGTYDVTFTLSGFTVPAQVVEASAAATAVLDMEMAVGGLAAEVVVVGTRAQPRSVTVSVSNSSSGRCGKLDHAPAVGDPTHMVEFGTGRRAFAREA